MLLFETPQGALQAIEGDLDITELNLGSMAHSAGEVVCSKTVAMDMNDVETIEKIKSLGVKYDVRKVPADSRENVDNLLYKAKSELANK